MCCGERIRGAWACRVYLMHCDRTWTVLTIWLAISRLSCLTFCFSLYFFELQYGGTRRKDGHNPYPILSYIFCTRQSFSNRVEFLIGTLRYFVGSGENAATSCTSTSRLGEIYCVYMPDTSRSSALKLHLLIFNY